MAWRKIMHKDISLHIHISLYFIVIVVFGANRMRNTMYHAKCIQTTVKLPASVQVWGAISSRGLLFREK